MSQSEKSETGSSPSGGLLLLGEKLTTLILSEPVPHVLEVCLNRPSRLNAMNRAFWREFRAVFEALNSDSHFRVALITAKGKHFTAGLDLAELAGSGGANSFAATGNEGAEDVGDGNDDDDEDDDDDGTPDIGRTAVHLREHVLEYQETFRAMEKSRVPTIVAVHGACIGGGVDLCCSACIRYACAGSYICVQEVNVGLAADVGTLQKIPKLGVPMSVVNEWAYTARKVPSMEAQRVGFFSAVLATPAEMRNVALKTAGTIAEKSPIAVYGTKKKPSLRTRPPSRPIFRIRGALGFGHAPVKGRSEGRHGDHVQAETHLRKAVDTKNLRMHARGARQTRPTKILHSC
eukprot:INCI9262.1.p1 GENE.INCI9262.1~~INCI9262.1.p1  ORF type:complete len:347 (-),score=48.96 INCI9262.1:74-1114(-)